MNTFILLSLINLGFLFRFAQTGNKLDFFLNYAIIMIISIMTMNWQWIDQLVNRELIDPSSLSLHRWKATICGLSTRPAVLVRGQAAAEGVQMLPGIRSRVLHPFLPVGSLQRQLHVLIERRLRFSLFYLRNWGKRDSDMPSFSMFSIPVRDRFRYCGADVLFDCHIRSSLLWP